MKKIFSIAIVVLMLFALVACNNDELEKKNAELEQANKALLEQITQLTQGKSQLEQMIEELERDIAVLEDYCLTHVGNVEDLDQSKEELTELMLTFEEKLEEIIAISNEIHDNRELDDEIRDGFYNTYYNINILSDWLESLEERIEKLEGVTQKVDEWHDSRVSMTVYTEPTPGDACGYSFENRAHNIDDVKIRFYYGHPFERGSNIACYADINAYVYDVCADDAENNDPVLLFRVEDYSDVKHARKKTSILTSVDDFNSYEDIVLPRELFNYEYGCINLVLRTYEIETNESRGGIRINLYYRTFGNMVFLYEEDPTEELE